MAYSRRDIRGGAAQTTLNGGITSGSTSCVITSATGWPDGSSFAAFYIVIDPGLSTEEKILCSTRSSTTVNFTTRGADGTSAAAHSSGATIYPCITAVDIDEANNAVSQLLGSATAAGQIPVVSATNTITMLQAKTSAQILQGNGTTLVSNAVTGDVTIDSSGVTTIGANKVTNAKAAGMTRGTIKTGSAAGAASDLTVGTASQFLRTDGTDPIWSTMTGDVTLSGATATVAPAANVAMGSHKLTGLSAGSTAGDSVRYEQALLNALVTTKGDLIAATASATPARLAVGSDQQELEAASGATPGVAWHNKRPYVAATAPPAPAAGDLWYDTTTGGLKEYQSVTTGWTPPWNTAWGELAYAQVTAQQIGITSATGTDLTSLTSGALTFVANRKIKITGSCLAQNDTLASGAILIIFEGASALQQAQQQCVSTGVDATLTVTHRRVPTAAAHTYKLAMAYLISGTVIMDASATNPAFILVEDIGPSAAPA